jgi:hypothetical protein
MEHRIFDNMKYYKSFIEEETIRKRKITEEIHWRI